MKGSIARILVCLALVLTAVSPATATAAEHTHSGMRPIPKVLVVNMTKTTSYGYACKLLRSKGFKVVEGPPTYSKTIRPWYVGVQSAYGNLVKGTTVVLRRSAGPAPVYKWKWAVSSNYGNEPQHVAGNYPGTGYMDEQGWAYFAHKHMDFGTRVIFRHNGKTIIGFCADRGPYVGGREFDMGLKIMRALNLDGVDKIEYAIVK